jgi:hypothetical protein
MLFVVCENNRQTTMMTFKRKQIGRASLLISIISILSVSCGLSANLPGTLFIITGIAAFGWLFSSQTVEVDGATVRWNFGKGFWKRQLALADIAAVTEVQTPLWQGWGIRKVRGGWCYSVSGRKAVELTLKNGRRIILGTDRPRELAAALAAA